MCFGGSDYGNLGSYATFPYPGTNGGSPRRSPYFGDQYATSNSQGNEGQLMKAIMNQLQHMRGALPHQHSASNHDLNGNKVNAPPHLLGIPNSGAFSPTHQPYPNHPQPYNVYNTIAHGNPGYFLQGSGGSSYQGAANAFDAYLQSLSNPVTIRVKLKDVDTQTEEVSVRDAAVNTLTSPFLTPLQKTKSEGSLITQRPKKLYFAEANSHATLSQPTTPECSRDFSGCIERAMGNSLGVSKAAPSFQWRSVSFDNTMVGNTFKSPSMTDVNSSTGRGKSMTLLEYGRSLSLGQFLVS